MVMRQVSLLLRAIMLIVGPSGSLVRFGMVEMQWAAWRVALVRYNRQFRWQCRMPPYNHAGFEVVLGHIWSHWYSEGASAARCRTMSSPMALRVSAAAVVHSMRYAPGVGGEFRGGCDG
jgi:hypothetical protein